jgi:hypothetical protein
VFSHLTTHPHGPITNSFPLDGKEVTTVFPPIASSGAPQFQSGSIASLYAGHDSTCDARYDTLHAMKAKGAAFLCSVRSLVRRAAELGMPSFPLLYLSRDLNILHIPRYHQPLPSPELLHNHVSRDRRRHYKTDFLPALRSTNPAVVKCDHLR